MNIFEWVLVIALIFMLILEIRGYYQYTKAAENLQKLAAAMQEAFQGVITDIVGVNESLTAINLRADRNDEAIEVLNSNDAVIEIYLNLFRDALGIEADKLSRVGKVEFPESES